MNTGCVEVQVGEVDPEREETVGQDHRERARQQMHGVRLEEQGQHQRVGRDQHDDHRGDQQRTPADEVRYRQAVSGGNA